MNVLSDFIIRVNAAVPETTSDQNIAELSQVITEKDELIHKYETELKRYKSTKSKISAVAKGKSKAKPLAAAKSTKSPTASSKKSSVVAVKPGKPASKERKSPVSKKPKTKSPKAGKK